MDEVSEKAFKWYTENQKIFQLICEQVRGNLEQALDNRSIHDIQCRSKSPESFRKKFLKVEEDGSRKYQDPANEITDLSAVRIIVFLREDVKRVSDKIHELYDVSEDGNVSARQQDQSKFGYESRHILIELPKRQYFGQKKRPSRAICEIQVRTILQHAWAEMEHDIGYKNDIDIPPDLRRRFSALAGLLEIADTEFERIQKDSLALRSQVKKELVADITRQVIGESKEGTEGTSTAKSVRTLIAERKYAEAIEKYTEYIKSEPKSVTLYIGRAKAYFLNGSTTVALRDLDKVDELQGKKPTIQRLRALFTDGDMKKAEAELNLPHSRAHSEILGRANSAMAKGEGVEAFDAYCELESTGYSRPFSLFGKAMALTLESDTEGALDAIDEIRILDATPMKINIVALRQIIRVTEGQIANVSLSKIKESLSEMKGYDFEQTALRYLELGFQKQGVDMPGLAVIFKCLRSA